MDLCRLIERCRGRVAWKYSVALILFVGVGASQADNQVTVESDAVENVSTKDNGSSSLESFFYRIWRILKFSGLAEEEIHVTDNVVVVAGIRGVEVEDETTTARAENGGAVGRDIKVNAAAYRAYNTAVARARKGDPEELEQFLEDYGSTELAPYAEFALAVFHADHGDQGTAVERLERFMKNHPSHQFVYEAQSLIGRLDS